MFLAPDLNCTLLLKAAGAHTNKIFYLQLLNQCVYVLISNFFERSHVYVTNVALAEMNVILYFILLNFPTFTIVRQVEYYRAEIPYRRYSS